MSKILRYPSDTEREAYRTLRKDFPGHRWSRKGGLRTYYAALFKNLPEWNQDLYEEMYLTFTNYFAGSSQKISIRRPDVWAPNATSLIFVEVENTHKISKNKFQDYAWLVETEGEWNPIAALHPEPHKVQDFQVWTTNKYGKGIENITPRLLDYVYGK